MARLLLRRRVPFPCRAHGADHGAQFAFPAAAGERRRRGPDDADRLLHLLVAAAGRTLGARRTGVNRSTPPPVVGQATAQSDSSTPELADHVVVVGRLADLVPLILLETKRHHRVVELLEF